MRANRNGIHSKEWHGNECTVSSQTKDRVAQLESSCVLFGIILVKVNV